MFGSDRYRIESSFALFSGKSIRQSVLRSPGERVGFHFRDGRSLFSFSLPCDENNIIPVERVEDFKGRPASIRRSIYLAGEDRVSKDQP